MIRVLVVDDDPVCCDGLRQVLDLAEGVEVVGVASSGEEAYRIGRQLRPDIVILDADLPRSACMDAMLRLSVAQPRSEGHPAFICLSVYPDQHDAAIQAGANRFLRKDGSPRELIAAIRELAEGRPNGASRPGSLAQEPNEPDA